ncbi:SDR family oxidoreductase [Terrarubrum flagellatum]|uniref:SDR family oxidoreductase n=1 Tax=Terrirubrum flagellatum TaxID=2895980 RepID=UPI0031456463
MGRIEGKVAVIIGAAGANNMGQTIARLFAREGARVMVAGRREEHLAPLAEEIGGGFALCDITRKSEVEALADAAVAKFGKVDIGVNATGWGLVKPFLSTTEEELQAMTALQFVGPFYFMQAMVRVMTNGGSLIQISSATATIMLEDHAAYMGAKAGADHVVRCVANEFGARGVKANSISPGITESPMTAKAFRNQAVIEAFRKEYPLGRVGTQDDVAQAALWLASDESFISGQNLQINGGLTLRRNPRNQEIIDAAAKARAERAAS